MNTKTTNKCMVILAIYSHATSSNGRKKPGSIMLYRVNIIYMCIHMQAIKKLYKVNEIMI